MSLPLRKGDGSLDTYSDTPGPPPCPVSRRTLTPEKPGNSCLQTGAATHYFCLFF